MGGYHGLIGAALLAMVLACAPAAAMDQRIASLNLCTDQLLLLLVPRARIASISEWAARPESSYMVAAAQGIPLNAGLVEDVLPQRPDLIITGEFNDPVMVATLRRLGQRVAVLRVPDDLDAARGFIQEFGELVGEPAAAQRLVADMDTRLQRIDARTRMATSAPLAAVYAPNGITAGRGTAMEDMLRRAGLRNLASELGLRGYVPLSLELLIAGQPDVLVLDTTAVSADDVAGDSVASGYLQHPALAGLAQRVKVVVLPPPLSVCIGPMTIDAIERLQQVLPVAAR